MTTTQHPTPTATDTNLREVEEAIKDMLGEFDADEFGSEGQMRTCLRATAALALIPELRAAMGRKSQPDGLVEAAKALRDDLLDRAEWDGEAKVVCAGSGAWFRFVKALDAALHPTAREGDSA